MEIETTESFTASRDQAVQTCIYQEYALALYDHRKYNDKNTELDYLEKHFDECFICRVKLRNLERDMVNLDRLIPQQYPPEAVEKVYKKNLGALQKKYRSKNKLPIFILLMVRDLAKVLFKPLVMVLIGLTIYFGWYY